MGGELTNQPKRDQIRPKWVVNSPTNQNGILLVLTTTAIWVPQCFEGTLFWGGSKGITQGKTKSMLRRKKGNHAHMGVSQNMKANKWVVSVGVPSNTNQKASTNLQHSHVIAMCWGNIPIEALGSRQHRNLLASIWLRHVEVVIKSLKPNKGKKHIKERKKQNSKWKRGSSLFGEGFPCEFSIRSIRFEAVADRTPLVDTQELHDFFGANGVRKHPQYLGEL